MKIDTQLYDTCLDVPACATNLMPQRLSLSTLISDSMLPGTNQRSLTQSYFGCKIIIYEGVLKNRFTAFGSIQGLDSVLVLSFESEQPGLMYIVLQHCIIHSLLLLRRSLVLPIVLV
jgi:hypothetical protein